MRASILILLLAAGCTQSIGTLEGSDPYEGDGASECDDGRDNDADGLTDCEDDECWGASCHPAGVRSRVTDGQLNALYMQYTHRSTWSEPGGCGHTVVRRTRNRLELGSLHGTVQVLPEGVGSWSAGASPSTCTWQLDSAQASFLLQRMSNSHWWYRTVTAYPVTRGALTVAPGCRLDDSPWFLPEGLWIRGSGARAGYSFSGPFSSHTLLGPSWYAWQTPSLVGSTVHSNAWSSWSCERGATTTSIHTYEGGVWVPASSYQAVPAP